MATQPQTIASHRYARLFTCLSTLFNHLSLIMQNKPNLLDSQMNASIFSKMAYENKSNWTFGENKPNSNPIKANFKAKQTQSNPKEQPKNPEFPPNSSVQSAISTVRIEYMKKVLKNSKPIILFFATRPQFLVASAAPVLVGSTLGYAIVGSFNPGLFILALLAIMALHSGANMANDYFDHTSWNDWKNENPTPFSGGRRYIQEGILSPKATLLATFVALAVGSTIGFIIVLLTKSVFILVLGLIGLLGGFFYTAAPVRLGYRSVGEFVIFLLFGLLPVYASYYLQTETIDTTPLVPACLVGILIFLVILVNEFPDAKADAAVNKKTLVVRFGVPASVWIYRIAIAAGYIITAAAIFILPFMWFAGLLYLFTLPIAVVAIKFANKKDLTTPGLWRANQTTILLHSVGNIALTTGFIISGVRNTAM